MHRISRDQVVYHFDRDTPPVLEIEPGETVLLETHDTTTGRIHEPADVPKFVAVRDPQKVNPATGPIFIRGAEPGDALAVEILEIELGPLGWVRALRGAGVLQDGIEQDAIIMVRTEGDDLVYGDLMRLPARPMVGVLGTAPAEGRVYTAHPGAQGSNMDHTSVREGATVWLPVHVPGALLAIGDIHASMGDGEISGTGVEISGEVTVRVTVVKGAAPARPWIETADEWIATGQGETLELAVETATEGLASILQERLGLSRTEAFLMISSRGDLRIGQCARIRGCDATVSAAFPKGATRL